MNPFKNLPRRELLEVVTVGLPFCGFKILTGHVAFALADSTPLEALGILLTGLGLVDLVINSLNLLSLLSIRRRRVAPCLFEVLARRRALPVDFGNSVDVMVSFAIVAVMVGLGLLRLLPHSHLAAWNTCVVFNVLGAGLSRFGSSLKAMLPSRDPYLQ